MTTPNLEGRIARRLQLEGNVDHEDVIDFHEAARIATLEAEDSDAHSQKILHFQADERTGTIGLKPLTLNPVDLTALTNAGLNLRDTPRDVPPSARAGAAVDDDLLRDIGLAVYVVIYSGQPYEQMGHELLASEPMQRLKAAWTAEAVDVWATACTGHTTYLAQLERERDEARAELSRVERERDAARADYPRFISIRDELQGRIDVLNAAVERLRAAVPDLPDVGPVTRDQRGIAFLERHSVIAEQGDQERLRRDAARCLALAAFLDREAEERAAADTTTDDEKAVQHALASAESFVDDHGEFNVSDLVRVAARAALQHRARTNGEDA